MKYASNIVVGQDIGLSGNLVANGTGNTITCTTDTLKVSGFW